MPKGSGRRPLPTAVKKLRGNPGKRKLNDKEPSAQLGEPEMPRDLPKAAAAEWKRIVPELQILVVLATVDRAALAAYCHAFARWFEAEREVKRLGIVVEEPILIMGEATDFVRYKKNPAVTISEGAMKIMKSFLVEFGMTPSSRSRVRIEKPADDDPMDAFLKGAQPTPKHVN
ncbi:MAG: phage terminase small subunit P27 family [Chthoniobacterales bacterium]